MLIEKVDFNTITQFKEKDIVPVVVRIGEEYYEIFSAAKNADAAWKIFHKLFFYKIYLREKARECIDDMLDKEQFSSKLIVFSESDRTFANNYVTDKETAAKFAKNRYVIIMQSGYNNLVVLKRVIKGAAAKDISLYVVDKSDLDNKELKKELSALKKRCLKGKRANDKFKKATLVVGHINNLILTDEEKLIAYIRSEYKKRSLLGDIILDEKQEVILHDYMCRQLDRFVNGRSPEYKRVFAYGIVRYAMKYYNKRHSGDFWPHFKEEYGVAIPQVYQKELHDLFQSIMQANGKAYAVDTGNRIDNITMHSFVGDNSAFQLFDFLFDFWKHDLGRNAENMGNSSEGEFEILIEAMKNRTQNVMTHTSALLNFSQTRGAFKNRIRRIIKLINDSFWNDSEINETGNRINHKLNEWMRDPKGAFQKEKNYVAKHSSYDKGEILFHSPVLFASFEKDKLSINLPQQRLIECDTDDYPVWTIISTDGLYETISVEPEYKSDKIGYYVEKTHVDMPISVSLSGFEFILSSGSKQLKKYRIESDNLRFFDSKGRYIDHKSAIVPADFVSSISNSADYPILIDETVDVDKVGDLYIKQFNLALGEVIVLDDGTGIQAGQKLVEGLNEAYPVIGVKLAHNDSEYDVFSKLPKLLFISSPEEVGGISLVINGKQNRVCEKGIKEFKLVNDVLTRGYLVDLGEYIKDEGLFQILLSFPKYKGTREIANLAYIKNFQYEFIKAPYVFKSYGEISFPSHSGIVIDRCTSDGEWERQPFRNVFSFNFGERNPNSENYCNLVEGQRLHLQYDLRDNKYDLYFDIPALFWKYGANDEWNTVQPADMLLKELGKKQKRLYVGGPFSFTNSRVTTTNDIDISEEESEIKYQGGKAGYFDLSRIYEWFRSNRTERFRRVFISLNGKEYLLFNVICKSVIKEVNLFGDFDNGVLKGDVHIEGNETYTISISHEGTLICEDEPIIDNHFCIDTEVCTGEYAINIYELSEEEDNDDGFDIDTAAILLNDRPIIKKLINVGKLERQMITIGNISDRKGILRPLLKDKYVITKLRRVSYDEICENDGEILGIWDESIDPTNPEVMNELIMYKGVMGFEMRYNTSIRRMFNVLIVFKDISELSSMVVMQEKRSDGYCEYVSLMVDTNMGRIVSDEKEYSKVLKTRLLKLVFDDEYKFDVEVEEE